jgi:membrane protein implicated in regulation of membrane protease activity
LERWNRLLSAFDPMDDPKQTLDYATPRRGPSASDILVRVMVAAAALVIGLAGIVLVMAGVTALCLAVSSDFSDSASPLAGTFFAGVGAVLVYVCVKAFQSALRRLP